MSLTEGPSLAEFFGAEVAGGAGRSLFPIGPDPDCESYYIRRAETAMSPASFELMEGCSRESIEEGLRVMWEGKNPEMTRLAPTVARLAVELHDRLKPVLPEEETGAELSPFIYVMF